MRHLWIRYRGSGAEDIVNQEMLDSLLRRDAIQQFFRPSESRWVIVGVDPIRGAGGEYAGPERRALALASSSGRYSQWVTNVMANPPR